ncbi:MAG TPA: penicillin acylase family protein, partial [Candidatus Thermoplasmatota archaeon]
MARRPLPIPLGFRPSRAFFALALSLATGTAAAAAQAPPDLSRQVEIRRTAYGVPHILADNLEAAAFALAWVMTEDYGERVPLGILRARGESARYLGPEHVEGDFLRRLAHRRAVEKYHLVDADTRAVYEGFAAGVNRYLELHETEMDTLPRGLRFTGHDVFSRDVSPPAFDGGRRVIARLDPQPEDGSNAWAFHPSRTKSGRAILLRNPHLSWTSGYYEAHVTVPGVLDFYGDFRIGGPFGVIGGFNDRLGWATTNNDVDPDEVYALDADPERPDHVLFDGGSVPLRRELVTVEFRNGPALNTATREFWTTPLGPVIHRADGKVYVARVAGDGEHRGGQQFLRMMRAQSLEEWKDAMRMLARETSNFTYADADGNVFYVWNGTVPRLPHAPGGDTLAVPARRTSDVWTRLIPWDSLPQLQNPRGGYLHNENDSYHFANLNEVMDPSRFPPNLPGPRLRLRSQHALELIRGDEKVSLEDVVRLKHSYRMLLADRVLDDLVAAVREAGAGGEVAGAIALLEAWDRTA